MDAALAKDAWDELSIELNQARAIIQNAADGIFRLDHEGRTTFVNPQGERMFGWPAEDLLGQKLHDILHYKHADGSDFPMEDCPLGQVFATGRTLQLHEDVFWRRDGQALPVACSNAAILREGEVIGSVLIVRDVSERVEAEKRRQLLVNELNHRVKNTLSVVQNIARQSFRNSEDRQARDAFDGRLAALSAAHNLLTDESWAYASLEALLTAVLQPFGAIGFRVFLQGPSVSLAPGTAVTMTLAIHELATNASKYGSLSNETGTVNCEWWIHTDCEGPRLRMEWAEAGGPPVTAPTRPGFGSRMIKVALAAELDGQVSLEFAPQGVRCTIDARLPGSD